MIDTILITVGISDFILLIGLVINSINGYSEERKTNEIESYSSLIGEDDTNNQITYKLE